MATATQGRELGQEEVERLRERLNAWLNPRGYEAAPFLMGWYNSMLDQEHYVLPHEASTLGFSILSWSPMFEKALLPAYLDMSEQERLEPVNSTSKRIFQSLRDQVLLALSESQSESESNHEVETVFDFDFVGRRPKLIVQVMGHVSGQAYYYQKLDVRNPGTWRQGDSSHVYGCSIHPRYGGWFGFRGALILKGVTAPSLPRVSPPDVVPEDEARMRLLDLFNRWDPGWRSVVPVAESDRYSPILQEFFDTPPTDRVPIIQRALQHSSLPSLSDPSPS